MKPAIEDLHLTKAGKLFSVKYLTDGCKGTTYTVKVNYAIDSLVGSSPGAFESYLRKSFRNFYNSK